MKNSKEQKSVGKKTKKHNLRLVWKNDNPKLQDPVRLQFIGELMPFSNMTIPIIKNLPWLKAENKDEQND